MRRPSGRALLLLFLLVAFGLLVFFALRGRQRTAPPPLVPSPAPSNLVRIGTVGRPSSLPVHALDRLAGESLDMDVQSFEDPGVMWQMLAAGQLDLVLTTLDQFALAIPRHDPGVMLFPSVRSVGSDAVLARPDVKRPEDLHGQRIAFVPGTGGEYLVVNYLSALPSVSYEVVPARNAEEALRWLRSGDVAAAAVHEPWLDRLRNDGFNVLWSSREILLTDVWVASRQVLRGEGVGPQGVEAVAQAWFSLVEHLRRSPGLALKAVAEETGSDQADLKQALEGLEFLSLSEARSFDQDRLADVLETLLHDWSLYGAFQGVSGRRDVDLSTVVDVTIVNKISLPSEAVAPPEEIPPVEAAPEETPPPPPPGMEEPPAPEEGAPPAGFSTPDAAPPVVEESPSEAAPPSPPASPSLSPAAEGPQPMPTP